MQTRPPFHVAGVKLAADWALKPCTRTSLLGPGRGRMLRGDGSVLCRFCLIVPSLGWLLIHCVGPLGLDTYVEDAELVLLGKRLDILCFIAVLFGDQI